MFVSKYSEEDKKRWIEEMKHNGKSAQAYAKEIGIPDSTLRFWLRKEMNSKYKESFGAIKIVEDTTPIDSTNNTGSSIKYYGSKIKIELEKGFDKEFLKKVVEVLVNDK